MNGADVRFLESLNRALECRGFRCSGHGGNPAAFELFTQAELELAGGLLAERDRDDLFNRRRGGGFDQPHHTLHQLGGLAGSRGGLDDER